MQKSVKHLVHFVVEITIAWGKLVAKEVQYAKVHLVGAMGICRMHGRLNIGWVVVEQVKNIMALMLIGANDSRANRDVIGDQGISHNPFHQAEVFGGVSGIDGMEQSFKFLPITAGMNGVPNVIVLENGQVGYRISYNIILGQGLLGCLGQSRQADLVNQCILFLPLLITQQIIFKAAKADTVATKNITRFQIVAKQPVN